MLNNKQVVVLMGGISSEKEISILSGNSVYNSLIAAKVNVIKYEISENLHDLYTFLYNRKNDIIVFNALHGTFGEDGTIQSLLDILQIPYTHSGRTASCVAMQKSFTKKIVKEVGVLCAKEQILAVKDLSKQFNLAFPVVVKPINEGSSVGVYIAKNMNDLANIQTKYSNVNQNVMIEEYIEGKEFTVGLIDGKALAVTEIIANAGAFYDYESKYANNGSQHIIGSVSISQEKQNLMLEQAEKIFEALGCRGIARVDFRGNDNNIFFLEINTHPGFTGTSLLPEQAIYNGISFQDVCMLLLKNAKYGE
ncbi:D-alanine--D-alanine ligase [Rickettsiales bacterium LUAb2]